MTVIADYPKSRNRPGAGIIPVETPAERHKREQFQILDAVNEGRAVRISITSKNYKSFVGMMNATVKPIASKGFYDRQSGAYISSRTSNRSLGASSVARPSPARPSL